MVSGNYIIGKLKNFVASDSGKRYLRQKGIQAGITKEEVKLAAIDLRNMLVKHSIGVCKSCTMLIDYDMIRINPVKEDKSGRYKITLTFNKNDLKRESFLSSSPWNGGKAIGNGVYDIIGLFTHGYTASKFVYGWWDSESTYARSHSLGNNSPGLKPNPFIDNAINEFKTKYAWANVEVTYPALWHS